MRASTSNSTLPLTTPCPTRGRTSMHASWIFHQWDCPCCLATNACSRCLLIAAMSPCMHGNAREAAPLMDWEGAVKELGHRHPPGHAPPSHAVPRTHPSLTCSPQDTPLPHMQSPGHAPPSHAVPRTHPSLTCTKSKADILMELEYNSSFSSSRIFSGSSSHDSSCEGRRQHE